LSWEVTRQRSREKLNGEQKPCDEHKFSDTLDPNVASRFLIAPKRDNEAFPIASGSLGSFGGFLSYDFRAHDFMLGRRNCQRFLDKYFVLPEGNPLFADCSSEMKARYRVDKLGKPHLPIVPLLGPAREEVSLDRWPAYTQAQLKTMMDVPFSADFTTVALHSATRMHDGYS
jgi:hypothetical protein